jgi:hypothetical protein
MLAHMNRRMPCRAREDHWLSKAHPLQYVPSVRRSPSIVPLLRCVLHTRLWHAYMSCVHTIVDIENTLRKVEIDSGAGSSQALSNLFWRIPYLQTITHRGDKEFGRQSGVPFAYGAFDEGASAAELYAQGYRFHPS